MIEITVNGLSQSLPTNFSLPDLLLHLGLENVPLVIEHNRQALLKSEWPATKINDADEIEFIRVVAGG